MIKYLLIAALLFVPAMASATHNDGTGPMVTFCLSERHEREAREGSRRYEIFLRHGVIGECA